MSEKEEENIDTKEAKFIHHTIRNKMEKSNTIFSSRSV